MAATSFPSVDSWSYPTTELCIASSVPAYGDMLYVVAGLTVDVTRMRVDGDALVAAAVFDVEVCAHGVLIFVCLVSLVGSIGWLEVASKLELELEFELELVWAWR
jgi:hypothetical protein